VKPPRLQLFNDALIKYESLSDMWWSYCCTTTTFRRSGWVKLKLNAFI